MGVVLYFVEGREICGRGIRGWRWRWASGTFGGSGEEEGECALAFWGRAAVSKASWRMV